MLRDHFHAPLRNQVGWKTIHGGWAYEIMRHLHGGILPPRYAAHPFVHMGRQIEIDVASVDAKPDAGPDWRGANGSGGTAVLAEPAVYAPPAPLLSAEAVVASEDAVEIRVRKSEDGWKLVAAIEIVSERNKDRPAARRLFASKCAGYLQAGVAVVIVDAVTTYSADMHTEIVDLLHLPTVFDWESPAGLSAVAYRTVEGLGDPKLLTGDGKVRLDVWPHPLAVGEPLPTVPLWLTADLAVPLDLDTTYAAAWEALRLA